jgi:hypothetical protein
MSLKPGQLHRWIPGYDNDEHPCTHRNGWFYKQSNEEWLATSLQNIPEGVDCSYCELCGEMWFRDSDGVGWHQKFWTAEEIAEVEENAKKYDAFFDLPDDTGE